VRVFDDDLNAGSYEEITMARKTSKFMLGLFVTMGILIGIMFVIWVGAAKYFEEGVVYVTYFDESVQGLQMDSSVKYRGVDVGRVLKIRVAPDYRLVEVVMKIHLKGAVESTIVSQLKSAGITGIVFIELDRKGANEPVLAPKLPFKTEHPVIASRSSDIKQIMAGLADVYERIKTVDFEGISNQFKGAAKSVDIFFTSQSLTNTFQNLESASASLDKTIQKVNRVLDGGKIDQVLTETQQGLMETRQLVATLKDEVKAMKLAEKSEKAGNLADNLDSRSRLVAGNVETVLRAIHRNSEQLGKLLERLQNRPSDLIFSDPSPRDDVKEDAK
jgi:phospholipid/cholesterol/gamma-HCH transport system substrate-binding protein